MSRMRKVAMVAYAVAVGSLVLGATVYLTRSEFLFYHAQAVGMAWEAVPVNTRLLMLAMIHMVGALGLGAGCALVAILAVAFRRGELWADWTIPTVLFIWEAAGLQTSSDLAAKTGAHTPWPLFIALVGVTVAGAVLCASARHRKA